MQKTQIKGRSVYYMLTGVNIAQWWFENGPWSTATNWFKWTAFFRRSRFCSGFHGFHQEDLLLYRHDFLNSLALCWKSVRSFGQSEFPVCTSKLSQVSIVAVSSAWSGGAGMEVSKLIVSGSTSGCKHMKWLPFSFISFSWKKTCWLSSSLYRQGSKMEDQCKEAVFDSSSGCPCPRRLIVCLLLW